MRQFYLATQPQEIPQPGQVVALDNEESHHLFTVLRGGRDLVLNLTDGRGHRFTGRISGRNVEANRKEVRNEARIEILTCELDQEEALAPHLVLACAVVKGKRFEWALEKAVEMGVHKVIPLKTDHGVIEPGGGKQKRWQTIMISALKQSGRSWLPELADVTSLSDFKKAADDFMLFGAVPGQVPDAQLWGDFMGSKPDPLPGNLTILIGPEGGWSDTEMEYLLGLGARPVQLGPHVLRTETAALAGLTAIQSLRQDWL